MYPFLSSYERSQALSYGPTHVAPLEFPRETGLILRGAGKAGNPFQTTQGNRLSCRDQEGRRGSEEAEPGPSVFPLREPGVSGDFWWSQEGCQGPFRPSGRNRGLPLRRRGGQGPHLAKRWEQRGFSRVAAGFSCYDGDLSLPLRLALGSPIFPSPALIQAVEPHECISWLVLCNNPPENLFSSQCCKEAGWVPWLGMGSCICWLSPALWSAGS